MFTLRLYIYLIYLHITYNISELFHNTLCITEIRNTLDCNQSNAYSSRVIFPYTSPNLPFRSFSLYLRSPSYPPLQNNLLSYASTVVIVSEGKVRSLYTHEVNWIMHFRDMAIWTFQNRHQPPSWISANPKWHRWICRPRKPHPRTKHEGDRLTRCRVMAIWNFPKMCEKAPRSVVRRSSIFILLTLISYTPRSLH